MRVALIASTIAFLAGSPAFAQCIYVACNSSPQQAPVYQAPAYQAPAPYAPPRTSPGYDEGYAAGLASRPARVHRRTQIVTVPRRTSTSLAATQSHSRKAAKSAQTTRNRVSATRTRHAVASTAPRVQTTTGNRGYASTRRVATGTTAHQTSVTQHSSNYGGTSYHDPIKDRAASYRPQITGQSTTMASMMSSSSSYRQSTTTWTGPASVVNQGGQVCGWGARIVSNSQGYAQRQAVWVCQCPQGWRPPGY